MVRKKRGPINSKKSSLNKRSENKSFPLNVFDLMSRYLILVLAGTPGLFIFYFIFTPLTVYPVYLILKLFFDVILFSETILILGHIFPIELIPACIAGSAYYLLLVLNLSTPGLKFKKRLSAIFFSFGIFLVINILRIVLLSFLAYTESAFFDVTHQFLWYAVSTLFVVGIWFVEVKIFKITEIPFYSDLKKLFSLSKTKKKKN
ncbi:pacearchaeosortase [Patescibacteria group bacterium]|nr:pacearchaeosortase [Patescibacteria group bacterium]